MDGLLGTLVVELPDLASFGCEVIVRDLKFVPECSSEL